MIIQILGLNSATGWEVRAEKNTLKKKGPASVPGSTS